MVKSLNVLVMVVWSRSPEQGCVKRSSPGRGCEKQQYEYGAIANGVGENPLNGNGVVTKVIKK